MNIISISRSITVDSEFKRLRRRVNMHVQCLIYGFPAKHAKGVDNSGRHCTKKPRISTCSSFKTKIRVFFFKIPSYWHVHLAHETLLGLYYLTLGPWDHTCFNKSRGLFFLIFICLVFSDCTDHSKKHLRENKTRRSEKTDFYGLRGFLPVAVGFSV